MAAAAAEACARVPSRAMAAAAAEASGVLQPLTPGSRWPSRKAFSAAVAAHSKLTSNSIVVYKSDPRRLILACPASTRASKCSFSARLSLVKVEDGAGDAWVMRKSTLHHSCDGSVRRKRNYSRDVVMHASGELAQHYVAPTGTGGGGPQQLCAMVHSRGGLSLGVQQAREHIRRSLGATSETFVDQLQLVEDYLRQMQVQDPHGACDDACPLATVASRSQLKLDTPSHTHIPLSPSLCLSQCSVYPSRRAVQARLDTCPGRCG